jgi:predicted dehydrogenase
MIRMGLIGCGQMGMVHLRGLNELKDIMRFTALVDTDPAKTARAAAHLAESGITAVQASDYRQITDHVDAVLIALPHDLHYASAAHFLAHGKHVLLEKPLALTQEECLHLIELDKSPDPMLMVAYPLRSDPAWIKLGQLIHSKTFGEIFQVSIWTEQYTDLTRGAWLGQAARLGGGQLFSHGCHYIDQLLLWLGNPIEGTHIGTNRGTPWMEKEGTSNVTLRFENDVLAYHFGTWGARGSRLKYSVHIHTTQGMLEFNRAARMITLHVDKSGGDPHFIQEALAGQPIEKLGPTETVIHRFPEASGKAVNEQAINFINCIHEKRPSISPASDALQSLRVIWKLYEAEHNKTVADLRGLGFKRP